MRSEGMVGASVVIGTAFLAYLAFGSETALASVPLQPKPTEAIEPTQGAQNVLNVRNVNTLNNYQGGFLTAEERRQVYASIRDISHVLRTNAK